MKNFSIILIACFAVFQLANADTNHAKECLIENGFKDTDLNLLTSIGKQNFWEVLKDEHREKFSCVLACIFHKENPGRSLNGLIKDVLSEETERSENLRKEMLQTLSTCTTQAGDDDCKLLHCIKITELPFYDLLDMFVVTRDLQTCFVDNGLRPSDAINLENLNGPGAMEKVLQKFDEDKLACAVTCVYSKKGRILPGETLQSKFEAKIHDSHKITGDQEKEMIETLNKCGTEAAGDNCKLVKCLKIFRPPFFNLRQ